MKYSKKQLGKELGEKIDKNWSPEQIGKWAYSIYFYNVRDLDAEMDDILQNLFMMEAGPEFAYTESELRLLVKMLINDEKDPIKKIYELKPKEENDDA